MPLLQRTSLRNLLLYHEIAFLILVTVTGSIGGFSAYFWQKNASESVRINKLSYINEQIRSELFRQIQEVIRARLLENPKAVALYIEYSRSIDKYFNALRSAAIDRHEDEAIQALHVSYREIQIDMNKIFSDPYALSAQNRIQILDPLFAERMLTRFGANHHSLRAMLADQQKALDKTREIWTNYAAIFISIPLILSILLVLLARHIVRKNFLIPISGVIEGANLIRSGNLEHKIKDQGILEVSELARTINKVTGDLKTSQNSLVEREKQAALGGLIPVVAHNIRNPLASIRATAQIISSVENNDELQQSKKNIIETTDRLERWVSALVSYLHPLKPNYRLIHASQMLQTAIGLLKPRIEEKRITIEQFGWENDVRLNADPDLMEQVFVGLLSNAIDTSPAQGLIQLGLKECNNELQITIVDQGAGLPFNPQPSQLTPGPSTKRFGTGLGIPIAFKICQKHGWKLDFQGVTNGGTTVTITAPIRVHEEKKA